MTEKQQCYIILTPGQSPDKQPGWTAKLFDPIRQEWVWIAGWHPNQQGAIEEAECQFQQLIRENQLTQAFKLVVDDFRQKGFSLAEILNGLAELAHRDSYPNQVGYFLEEASKAAE